MELEVEVLSAICKNKDLSVVMSQNIDECFVTHGDVYNEIKAYYRKYRAVPDAAVLEQKFPEFKPTEDSHATQYHVDKLKDAYLRDRLGKIGVGLVTSVKDYSGPQVLERLRKEMTSLQRLTNNVKDVDVTDLHAAEDYFDSLRNLTDDMGGTPGIKTGFKAIDLAYPTGMSPGHFIVLIGWPGRGKSWISEYLMCKAWEQGHRVMIISMEMSPEDMRNRIYTLMGSGLFRMSDFQRGMVNVDDFRSWGKKTLTDKPEFIIVSNEGVGKMTTDTIQAKIDQYKPSIVVVDYHQLATDSNNSSGATERNMNVSIELKQMAVRNNIPIVDIVAATMSDISDTEGPPMLSQVAWSRQIEYDADLAIAIHQHKDTGIVEMVERKNRHGTSFALWVEADFGRGTIKETYGDQS